MADKIRQGNRPVEGQTNAYGRCGKPAAAVSSSNDLLPDAQPDFFMCLGAPVVMSVPV